MGIFYFNTYYTKRQGLRPFGNIVYKKEGSYFLFSFNATRTSPGTRDRPLLTQQQFNLVNNVNVMQGLALIGCVPYLQPPIIPTS